MYYIYYDFYENWRKKSIKYYLIIYQMVKSCVFHNYLYLCEIQTDTYNIGRYGIRSVDVNRLFVLYVCISAIHFRCRRNIIT